MSIILELKKEIKELKASRFNQNFNDNLKRTTNTKPIANWKYCWTYSCNVSHYRKECKFPTDDHQPKLTIKNTIGGN